MHQLTCKFFLKSHLDFWVVRSLANLMLQFSDTYPSDPYFDRYAQHKKSIQSFFALLLLLRVLKHTVPPFHNQSNYYICLCKRTRLLYLEPIFKYQHMHRLFPFIKDEFQQQTLTNMLDKFSVNITGTVYVKEDIVLMIEQTPRIHIFVSANNRMTCLCYLNHNYLLHNLVFAVAADHVLRTAGVLLLDWMARGDR